MHSHGGVTRNTCAFTPKLLAPHQGGTAYSKYLKIMVHSRASGRPQAPTPGLLPSSRPIAFSKHPKTQLCTLRSYSSPFRVHLGIVPAPPTLSSPNPEGKAVCPVGPSLGSMGFRSCEGAPPFRPPWKVFLPLVTTLECLCDLGVWVTITA